MLKYQKNFNVTEYKESHIQDIQKNTQCYFSDFLIYFLHNHIPISNNGKIPSAFQRDWRFAWVFLPASVQTHAAPDTQALSSRGSMLSRAHFQKTVRGIPCDLPGRKAR